MARLSNPFAFSRASVTIIATAVYAALLAVLIVVQVDLPPLPLSTTPVNGINLTEAWNDLQVLTAQYHPYNSHANDKIHGWLVGRIKSVIEGNNASSTTHLFTDDISNLTFSSGGVVPSVGAGITVYFEGTNIITYVRGSKDDNESWWEAEDGKPSSAHGVLVNAHYDSVSTGYGSTDDGVGVISILQLISHYTTKGNEPKYGIVFLLNNGEEDFLNGARAFGQHPMSKFVHSFLNLEGAGAGGRAALFRSTDEEVTEAYAKSAHPFGTVISGDAFEKGLVKSQTDYVVFNSAFGYRGLDVAFIGPRSRYHTSNDDARHTGKKALWHMLSAAITTTRELTNKGISPKTDTNRSIWFDLFGRGFVMMRSHTFFALSITLLIVGPIVLLLTLIVLRSVDKLYLFSGSTSAHTPSGDDTVTLHGWRGLFRFPFLMLFSAAAPVALAYLILKENEAIVHSSPWPIWAMMISAFVFVAWFLARFADYARPSALTRAYGFGWICFAWWVFLAVALFYEEQVHLTGGYPALFFSATAFLTTWLSYLELFSLPKKKKFSREKVQGEEYEGDPSEITPRPGSSRRTEENAANDDNESTEQSSLLRSGGRSAYKTMAREDDAEASSIQKKQHKYLAQHDEQEWSSTMWTWMWFLNFIIIAPINVIVLGQLGFYLVEALHQTGQDGSNIFLVYIAIAVVTVLIFSPLVPIIHRLSWHIPIFLLLVLGGTVAYNLLAFPFSEQNQLKVFFQQQIDLNSGNNTVTLEGMAPFAQIATENIPSTSGQIVDCKRSARGQACRWTGPSPQVTGSNAYIYSKNPYTGLVNYNASFVDSTKTSATARISVSGSNTRACKLQFAVPVSNVMIRGQGPGDERLPAMPEQGSNEVRLWSRTWNRTWTVDVMWDTKQYGSSLAGRAICLWSDVNQKGVIPAFDEVKHYVPTWVAVTKGGDGLVEGYKTFNITA